MPRDGHERNPEENRVSLRAVLVPKQKNAAFGAGFSSSSCHQRELDDEVEVRPAGPSDRSYHRSMATTIILLLVVVGFGFFIARQLREQRPHEGAPPDRAADRATGTGRAEVEAWARSRDHGAGGGSV